jgi:hypothetical protein
MRPSITARRDSLSPIRAFTPVFDGLWKERVGVRGFELIERP